MAWGVARHQGTSNFLFGDGEAPYKCSKQTCSRSEGNHDRWRSGSTASRQLSEVKHVPAQLVLRWVAALEPWVEGISNFYLVAFGVCANRPGN